MHHPALFLTHCPAARSPPMDSGLAVRADVETGSGAGVLGTPCDHGWARIRRGLVTDGQRCSLKYSDRHNRRKLDCRKV